MQRCFLFYLDIKKPALRNAGFKKRANIMPLLGAVCLHVNVF